MSEKNILISYTKWIVKWLLILGVFASSIIGSILYYEYYNNQLVPMISLKCEKEYYLFDEDDIGDIGFYLIQKERGEEKPKGIYRSIVKVDEEKITKNTKDTAVSLYRPYLETDDKKYIFKDKYGNDAEKYAKTVIDRETLEMELLVSMRWDDECKVSDDMTIPSNCLNENEEDKLVSKFRCESIKYDDYLDQVKNEIAEYKSKLKI